MSDDLDAGRTYLRALAGTGYAVPTWPRALGGTARDPHGERQTLCPTAPSPSIRGGTDEIPRDVLGERVPGLPPEPRVDREVPFAQLPRPGARR